MRARRANIAGLAASWRCTSQARTVERQGKAVTNFTDTLPALQSDLARESLKDPYKLDFLGLAEEAREQEIEQAVVDHLTRFLVELGAGFAYVGRQVHLDVGGEDFFLDLLFFHLKLRCYLVIEIKAVAFKPEHLGQLAFYIENLPEPLQTSLPTIEQIERELADDPE